MSKRLADLRARNKAGRHVSLNEAEELLHEITRLRLLEADLAAAQAVIAKLPTYEDTGKRFVPGRDGAWAMCGEEICAVQHGWWSYGTGKWVFSVLSFRDGEEHMVDAYGSVYSTKAAAEAAKGADHAK